MKNSRFRYVVLSGCLLLLASGCAKQQDYNALQQKVTTQDQQLRQLQPGIADTWSQMQAMRQEINALKGQLDDLNNAGGARNLVDKVNRHDAALRQVESSLALDLNLDAPMEQSMPGMPGSMQGGLPPSSVPGQATGSMTISPGTRLTPPQSQAQQQESMASALFEAGVRAFNVRNYAEAQRSFVDFTKNYASNHQIGNAWYYIGECNFQLNKFSDAALAYEKVITQYSKSSRVASAYLKQGICFSKLGQKAASTARLQELIKKYPTSAEAARAKSFLRTNS